MHDLGIFRLEFQKAVVIFEISILRICVIAKFYVKTKMPKLGTKNALFVCFWAIISKKTIVIFEISTLIMAC